MTQVCRAVDRMASPKVTVGSYTRMVLIPEWLEQPCDRGFVGNQHRASINTSPTQSSTMKDSMKRKGGLSRASEVIRCERDGLSQQGISDCILCALRPKMH